MKCCKSPNRSFLTSLSGLLVLKNRKEFRKEALQTHKVLFLFGYWRLFSVLILKVTNADYIFIKCHRFIMITYCKIILKVKPPLCFILICGVVKDQRVCTKLENFNTICKKKLRYFSTKLLLLNSVKIYCLPFSLHEDSHRARAILI